MKKIFDYKKEEKQFYQSSLKPTIIHIPKMKFLRIEGSGDPSVVDGDFTKCIQALYPVAYTLKMSYKGDYIIKDFFEYVVPPLEGYWWQDGIKGYDKTKKHLFSFILKLRLPDFITKEDVLWAINKASVKNNKDYSNVKYEEFEEGLVVQCMHIGSYDDEYLTTKIMEDFITENGYKLDFNSRNHHELYISDFRKTEESKLKTILRHPIK